MGMSETLLDSLNLPEDLKTLSIKELEMLAVEIRQRLLEIGNTCGGHLASNLGVVELTIVLHTLLSSPTDKILWDTSHQTYVHKMLTGRLDQMFTIRQDGGLSGFAKITESEHDTFGAGHASTALSAAIGIAHARDHRHENYSVFSVVGDASFSGGMTFEALNNVSRLKKNLVCILNDNNMSISRPVGTMSDYITRVRTSNLYDQAKKRFEHFINKIPKLGEPLMRRLEKTAEHIRDIVLDTNVGVMFEDFGFKYIGPIDGHDISTLMAALKYAKSHEGPIMVHIITQKGKGHPPAELDPEKFHGVKPKQPSPPPESVKEVSKSKNYTQVFGDTVIDICHKRDDVVVVTPAMEGGSGLTPFKSVHPDKFYDVGIAEGHAVTFSAGLARGGIVPILAIYSTFLQRGFDQMVHDICLQKLPVIFALDRAGLVGEDGPTHHGVLDFNFMLPLPNLNILAPKDGKELEAMLHWAVDQKIATSIRYSKETIPKLNGHIHNTINLGKAEVLSEFSTKEKPSDVTIIGVGSMAWPCYEASKILDLQGISSTVINLRFIKPLDTELLSTYLNKSNQVIVVEEGNGIGGVFHYIMHQFNHLDKPLSHWHQIAIPDEFVDHGKLSTLRESYSLNTAGIIREVSRIVNARIVA